jgi:predicted alpha/beta-hydrolase family hydrolase
MPGLLLTPGASATRDHSALVAIDAAMTPEGFDVERIDLPGSRIERAVVVVNEAAAALADRSGPVFLGGRSYGGRACSMAVADGFPAAGLVLISYPLHPPGKAAALRTAHFPALTVPCLFVSGTRDQFGTPDELETATAAIPGPVTHVWIEGGNHGLARKDAAVTEAVRAWLLDLRGSGPPARRGRSRGTPAR